MSALTVSNVKKKYLNGVYALKGVSFSIEKGDFYALLGPNGAGKSTLINIISTLVNKDSGSIEIMGYDTAHHPNRVKELLGLVPQEINFNIFSKTKDVLMRQAGLFGISARQAASRASELLDYLELTGQANEIVRHLSGGMKRRLMIARALMHEPKVLILDEPTAGVDIEIRRKMWKFIRFLNKDLGVTIVLTTHYLEEVEQHCNNVTMMHEGKVFMNASIRELLTRLDQNTLVLDLVHPLEKPITSEKIKVQQINDLTLEVLVPSTMPLNELFHRFDEMGIAESGLRNKTSRLEELFMNLAKGEI